MGAIVTQFISPWRQPMYPWPAPHGPFRAEDLHDLPPDGHRYEIVEGGLHVTPPVDIGHQDIADEIRGMLKEAAPAGWRPVRGVGIQLGDSVVVPDLIVLRPAAPVDATWADLADVALVVEVESVGTRRLDRFAKLALYAEAGIESYWRVERTAAGPVAHLYHRPSGGHYHEHRSVNPGESVVAEQPYQVHLAPASWLT